MAKSVTISRRDAVELIEQAAGKLTGGNKTEAVALALRLLLERGARAGDLFGAHKGSVRIGAGVDLTEPALDVGPGAQTGQELEH
jgi:hypothetical protein